MICDERWRDPLGPRRRASVTVSKLIQLESTAFDTVITGQRVGGVFVISRR